MRIPQSRGRTSFSATPAVPVPPPHESGAPGEHGLDVDSSVAILRRHGEQVGHVFGEQERRAITFLYHRFAGRLIVSLRRVALDDSDPDTVVHDTLVSLPKRLGRYEHRGEQHFAVWLDRVAANLALEAMRRDRRRGQVPLVGEGSD